MFSKLKQEKEKQEPAEKITQTIIAEGIEIIAGKIRGTGAVRIDGRYSGTIEILGHLVIGEMGYVEGEIYTNSAFVEGNIQGDITAETVVRLSPTAYINGNIDAKKVIMDEDAIFNGRCTMSAEQSKNEVSYISEYAKESGAEG